jgi:hypothetical protein
MHQAGRIMKRLYKPAVFTCGWIGQLLNSREAPRE